MLGLIGYAVATIFAAVLAHRWGLSLGARSVALVAPPIAFVVVVTIATAATGHERIVFYQVTLGAAAAVVVGALAVGAPLPRVLDVAVLGMGAFLVFGRLGCFHVACCHGRPRRRGVIYGPAHVAAGFRARWAGHPLFPTQLVEAAASLALVVAATIAALRAGAPPGTAALVYAIGYAAVRFALELYRGDLARPYALGLSEAQWCSLATAAACAAARPSPWTIAPLALLAAAALALIARRRTRALVLPPHLAELDHLAAAILADPAHARRDTRLGVGLSCHPLADGRLDWILSSSHPAWPLAARRIAHELWPGAEIIDGRTPGVVHVIAPHD